MIGLGCYNVFPFQLGGGDSDIEVAHQAILDALEPLLDPSDTTEHWAEAYAEAMLIAIIWAVNQRVGNQMIPERMLENLTTWERVLKLRPVPGDTDVERRKRVSARLRGLSNNSIGDIEDAAHKLLGANFVELVKVEAANVVTYWPGVNPGPPGFEFASNRANICARISKDGMSDPEFLSKRSALLEQLDGLVAAWDTITIGVGNSFVVNASVVNETFI